MLELWELGGPRRLPVQHVLLAHPPGAAPQGPCFQGPSGRGQRQGGDRLQRPEQGADPQARRPRHHRFVGDRVLSGAGISRRPSLFGGPVGEPLTHFFNLWTDRELVPALVPYLMLDVLDCVDEAGRARICARQIEGIFKKSLEELTANARRPCSCFAASWQPVRKTLASSAISSAAPLRPMRITSCSGPCNGRASSRDTQVLEAGRCAVARGSSACSISTTASDASERAARRTNAGGSGMKIVIVGGGPGGLYFALLMKKRYPGLRRRRFMSATARDDTFGFGVVFSDETLDNLMDYDRAILSGDHARILVLGRDRFPLPRRGCPLDRPRLLRHRAPHAADGAAGALPRARRQAEFLAPRSPISTNSPTPT